ncbi:CoA-transferase family III domain-containing protein [Podospora didyma]|uniref:CoA-transferase family III domain-containing protein n=1 Tax=Podospora didyma TaxID=330526 RepID=A0AAE0NYC7_9PEZI|nr:CoA-transferase family III domain-containing protein [Podospora didyma]
MAPQYSVPDEVRKLFQNAIIQNPLVREHLPTGALEASRHVSFEGSNNPFIPINWRFAESISTLKAYEATVLNVLLKKKYGVGPVDVKINTNHAQLFIMSPLLWALDPEGANLSAGKLMSPEGQGDLLKYFPEWDKYQTFSTYYRGAATNVYRTKDEKFFHLHGSMNPEPSLRFVGLPPDLPSADYESAITVVGQAVSQYTASDLQELARTYRQAGDICLTTEEYAASPHGQANAGAGLFEIQKSELDTSSPATWWPATPLTSAARPLAGLKVVDLTRIIAGPTISRGLAQLGASVMRITAPHLPDFSILHPDLNHGKWNACLDLREEADREKLRELIKDADIFLQGYRPGVLDKFGFGEADVLKMGRERGGDRGGIVYCAENCYGWNGPWYERSGWQQISDAVTGVSYEYGRALGNDEPVTPVFPNSDFCTGVIGITGVMTALIRRAEEGGSYSVKTALNYYNQWLIKNVGVYPKDVWEELRARQPEIFRHYHGMNHTLPRVMASLFANDAKSNDDGKLFKPEFFTEYHVKNLGKTMRIVAPVLEFPNGEVQPGFHVGTRTNGVDQPKWPDDLETEVVN